MIYSVVIIVVGKMKNIYQMGKDIVELELRVKKKFDSKGV